MFQVRKKTMFTSSGKIKDCLCEVHCLTVVCQEVLIQASVLCLNLYRVSFAAAITFCFLDHITFEVLHKNYPFLRMVNAEKKCFFRAYPTHLWGAHHLWML